VNKKTNRQKRIYQVKATGYNFEQIADGNRSFIIVPDDKKEGYEKGDELIIQKYSNDKKTEEFIRMVVHGFQKTGKGLMQGFVVLSLTREKKNSEAPEC